MLDYSSTIRRSIYKIIVFHLQKSNIPRSNTKEVESKKNYSVPRNTRFSDASIDPTDPFRCEKALFFSAALFAVRVLFPFSSIRLAVATTAVNDISMSDDLCFLYSLPSQSGTVFSPLALFFPSTPLLHAVSRLIGYCLINWPCYFY